MAVVHEKELLCKKFLSKTQKLLIDGKWVDAKSGKTFETINPATEEVLCRVAEGSKEDVDLAVKAARRAFESGPWKIMSTAQRAKLLLNLADLIEKNADELIFIEKNDNNILDNQLASLFIYLVYGQMYAFFKSQYLGNTTDNPFPTGEVNRVVKKFKIYKFEWE